MYKILCYGDSNTWGFNPATEERYDRNKRWPGVLDEQLGEEYFIVEEGLNGRTTVWEDPIEGHKSGKEYLVPCLETHKPLDLVIILLGTNDLKVRFSLSAFDIAEGAGALVEIINKSETGIADNPPEVLLIAPPPIGKLSEFASILQGAREKSVKFAEEYSRVADERGCHFLDSGNYISSSDIDGVHLEPGEHRKLGKAVARKVKDLRGR